MTAALATRWPEELIQPGNGGSGWGIPDMSVLRAGRSVAVALGWRGGCTPNCRRINLNYADQSAVSADGMRAGARLSEGRM